MKKNYFINALVALLPLISLPLSEAQSQNNIYAESASALPEAPAVQLIISIPDEYASQIVRENADNAVYFNFKKSDGTTVFLFQVNKISEYQWLKVKSQLTDPIILEHKDGFVYYALITDKDRIKGPDNKNYEEIYSRLRPLVSTIKITE